MAFVVAHILGSSVFHSLHKDYVPKCKLDIGLGTESFDWVLKPLIKFLVSGDSNGIRIVSSLRVCNVTYGLSHFQRTRIC